LPRGRPQKLAPFFQDTNMARIRFIAQGSNSLVGGFSHGDLLMCSDALAAHLVNEAGVAEYVKAQQPTEAEAPAPAPAADEPQVRTPKRKKA
jgi:hypothetical protein